MEELFYFGPGGWRHRFVIKSLHEVHVESVKFAMMDCGDNEDDGMIVDTGETKDFVGSFEEAAKYMGMSQKRILHVMGNSPKLQHPAPASK